MVKEFRKDKNIYFQCEECSFYYNSKEMAEKCEEWCRKYKSCNIEIVANAVKIS